MSFEERQRQMLSAELNPHRVKTLRVDGKEVEYLEAHDVIRQANEVFGFDGWSTIVHKLELVEPALQMEKVDRSGKTYEVWHVAYLAHVEVITALGGSHADVAVGESYVRAGKNPPNYDMAAKSAVSGATKRALRKFGAQFGLMLADENDPYGSEYARYLEGLSGGSRQETPSARSAPASESPPAEAPADLDGVPLDEVPHNATPPPAAPPRTLNRDGICDEIEKMIGAFRRQHGRMPATTGRLSGPSALRKLPDEDLVAFFRDLRAELKPTTQET